MTNEQIEQNAEAYAGKLVERDYHEPEWLDLYDAHIAGAHSRDEEINELKDRIERQKAIIAFDDLNEEALRKELNQLRYPWISVEERLPEKLENDCVSDYVLTRIDGPKQVWYLVNIYNYAIKAWEGCNNNTTHWMPIQELKKGE